MPPHDFLYNNTLTLHLGVDHRPSAHLLAPCNSRFLRGLPPVARRTVGDAPTPLGGTGRRHPSKNSIRHRRVPAEQRGRSFEVVVMLTAIAELLEPPSAESATAGWPAANAASAPHMNSHGTRS